MSRSSYHNPRAVNWSEGPIRVNKLAGLPTVQEYGLRRERERAIARAFGDVGVHGQAKLYTVHVHGKRTPYTGHWTPINIKCVNVYERYIHAAVDCLNQQYIDMRGCYFVAHVRVVEQHADGVPVRIVRQRDKVRYHGV